MTEKMLRFRSMEGGADLDESVELFTQNESGEYVSHKPSWTDEWDGLLVDDGTGDGETGDYKPDDSTLAGEKAAYDRVRDLLGSDAESFEYFPSDVGEENNQRFSMTRLKKLWGAETNHNIGIANFFYKNFLHENLRREAESTGIASHYLLVQEFYRAAKRAEKFAIKKMKGSSETRTMRFSGMDDVVKNKLEERCRDLASRIYSDAKAKIIAMHGGIHNR